MAESGGMVLYGNWVSANHTSSSKLPYCQTAFPLIPIGRCKPFGSVSRRAVEGFNARCLLMRIRDGTAPDRTIY